ncbi:MAG TPA: YbaN family protein [Phenylobacterium sp.]
MALGVGSLVLGAIGVVLPLLPTVPFVILAAYCFGRSDPRIERWLLEHPQFALRSRTGGNTARSRARARSPPHWPSP